VTFAQLLPTLVEVPVPVLVCVPPLQVGAGPQFVVMQLARASIALVQDGSRLVAQPDSQVVAVVSHGHFM
jgi:hypothetical protein